MTKIWRHSYHAAHYVRRGSDVLSPLDEERSPQRYAALSPDGALAAYVHGCNIFLKHLKS
jgi:hypothetical protein